MKALLLTMLLINQPPACLGNLNTPACKSFREMVSMRDRDLTDRIAPPSIAYVCFMPKTDEFAVITFDHPQESDFEQDGKNKYVWNAPGFAEIATYLDGVENYSTDLFGNWTAYNKGFNGATLDIATEGQKVPAIHIDPSEVDTSFSYKNSDGQTVTIGFKVRRSTRRFQRTFQFPVGTQQMTTSDTGYCAEFK